MANHTEEILDHSLHHKNQVSRRSLLPTWIKVFAWIFLITGVINVFGVLMSFFGLNIQLGLYGIETFTGMGILSITVQLLFLLKGIVALGLWYGKGWALNLALIDGVIGIVICIAVILLEAIGGELTFRLEILFLIPYMMKMYTMKDDWSKALAS